MQARESESPSSSIPRTARRGTHREIFPECPLLNVAMRRKPACILESDIRSLNMGILPTENLKRAVDYSLHFHDGADPSHDAGSRLSGRQEREITAALCRQRGKRFAAHGRGEFPRDFI